MLSPAEIRTFIDSDSASTRKQLARQGQRYYEGDHDIRNYRLFFINADGTPQEDKNRSNIKISHPFFTELVDQEAQYMLSGQEAFVRSDIPELQKALDDYFNEDFTAELYEVITGAVAKGFEYMYAYKDADGRTRFQAADGLGVVEVRAKDTDDGCEYVIYWYIYRFGMGFNAAQVGDGNVTNVVIKSRYALLDLKCNKLEIRLKQFMRKLLKIVLAEINESGGTDYQMQDVYFDFRREVMANALDNAQIALTDAQKQQAQVNTLLALADVLDDETLLENICDVLELDYKTIRGRTKSGDDTADVVLDDVPAEEDDAG